MCFRVCVSGRQWISPVQCLSVVVSIAIGVRDEIALAIVTVVTIEAVKVATDTVVYQSTRIVLTELVDQFTFQS